MSQFVTSSRRYGTTKVQKWTSPAFTGFVQKVCRAEVDEAKSRVQLRYVNGRKQYKYTPSEAYDKATKS